MQSFPCKTDHHQRHEAGRAPLNSPSLPAAESRAGARSTRAVPHQPWKVNKTHMEHVTRQLHATLHCLEGHPGSSHAPNGLLLLQDHQGPERSSPRSY